MPKINFIGEAFIFNVKHKLSETCSEKDYQNLRKIALIKSQKLENQEIFEFISAADRSSWRLKKYPLGKSVSRAKG